MIIRRAKCGVARREAPFEALAHYYAATRYITRFIAAIFEMPRFIRLFAAAAKRKSDAACSPRRGADK